MPAGRPPSSIEERLRLRDDIARLRRRLDRRADRIVDRAILFGGWREYVISHPVRSLAAAAGVGVTLAGLTPRLDPQTGKRLYDAALRAAWPQVWGELQELAMSVWDIRRGAEPAGDDSPRGNA